MANYTVTIQVGDVSLCFRIKAYSLEDANAQARFLQYHYSADLSFVEIDHA